MRHSPGTGSPDYPRPAAWQVDRRALPPGLGADHWSWLSEPRSLTRRIRQGCRAGFGLELLGERHTAPLVDERRALGLRPRQQARVRQVLLLCGEHRWVYARTVIPLTTLYGHGNGLASLGNRPLADVLFSSHRIRRAGMEYARLAPRHALFAIAAPHLAETTTTLWARRSVFAVADKPLLVTEVFLPALFNTP